jgi:hypothetical protein
MTQSLHTFSYQKATGWSSNFPDLDSEQTLVLAFADRHFMDDPEAFAELARAYPKSFIMGCSTSGEILASNISDASISVAVMRFSHTVIRQTCTTVQTAQDSFVAGQHLAQSLLAPDLRGVFVLSDGLNVNGSELVRGLRESLPPAVIVTGGLAGDGHRFERTWVIHKGQPQSQIITAIGLYGDRVHISHGSQGGWDIFGLERRVTKSRGNVLYELDGKPALELYKSYLGDLAKELPSSALLFPLSLRSKATDHERLVRTTFSVSEQEQSLTFAGDIPEGHLVQLMKANPERLIDGAQKSAQQSIQQSAQMAKPQDSATMLNIAISCVGRRLVLRQRTEEELEAILDVFPKGTQQVGFYSYGEIAPLGIGQCDLHNQTMTLTTIYES